MKERFESSNRPQLIAALRRQEFSGGEVAIAEALAAVGTLIEAAKGDVLIVQDGTDNDVYLLIAGKVGIVVNGAEIAHRNAGQHVGEMAAIEPSLPRSASVVALETVVALKLSSANFLEIGGQYPQIGLSIARELSRRLRQRNNSIFAPNTAPKLFIMSSAEAKHVALALRDGLEKDVFSKVWDDGVFFAGGYPLESLEQQVSESDFAVAIAEPDDILESRGSRQPTLRDNVLFELGLFMGKLSRYRAILIHPRIKDLKLPSDLHGLTLIPYDNGDPSTIQARIAPVCTQLRTLIKKLGVRTFAVSE